MLKFKSLAAIATVGVLLLTQTACNKFTTLNAVVTATEAAVTTFSGTGGLDPNVAALINKYLDAVSTASVIASEEWASGDSAVEKALRITEAFQAAVLPNVPGVPPQVAFWLKAVDVTVRAFLANYHPNGKQSMAVQAALESRPSFGDRRVLAGIKSRAKKLKVQLEAGRNGS